MNNYQKPPLISLKHVIDRLICKNSFDTSSYPTCGPEMSLKRYSGISVFRRSRSQLRRSHRRCSVRKGVPRNFTKFTGKHQACNFIKKRLWHSCFPVNFAKFLRTAYLTKHLRTNTSNSCPRKYVYLEISQNSQENSCVEVCF